MDSVDLKLYEQLLKISHEYNEYLSLLESVEIMSDNKLFTHYLKKKKNIESIALLFQKYQSIENEIKLNNEIFEMEKDEETKLKIKQENSKLEDEQKNTFDKMKIEFLKSTEKQQTAQVEITSKADDEFVGVLIEMIKKMFDEDISYEMGKTTVVRVSATSAYDKLVFLSGLLKQINRGIENLFKVVVLNIQAEEVLINDSDIVVEISKSSGAGGQHINKTESAVKLTHIPTGITAECQDERSQTKNKARAYENLKIKIMQKYQENAQKNIKKQRDNQKNAVFSSTPTMIFDFDKNKITDNRTGKNYELNKILNGETNLIESDLRI